MNKIDKMLEAARSRAPRYIEYTDLSGTARKVHYLDFIINSAAWCAIDDDRNISLYRFDIARQDIPRVIQQLERLPEGKKGTLFYEIVETLRWVNGECDLVLFGRTYPTPVDLNSPIGWRR